MDKRYKQINSVEFSLAEAEFQGLKQKEGRKFCAFVLEDFKVEKKFHMGHFFSSGWKFTLSIAINFSSVNGTNDDIGYLHSVAKPEENAYLKVMEQFSRNFVDISNEETNYQVYGFGCKDMEDCFPLNGDENPTVESFDDVKNLYLEQASTLEGAETFQIAPVLRKFKS